MLLTQLTGCFQFVPVSNTAVPPGAEVVVSINDPGRVAFAELLGPGVVRLEGPVLESTDTSLVLSVNTIQFLHLGVPTTWTGERIAIARDHITDVRERQFSRSRTAMMGALIGVGVAAVSLVALFGLGFETEPRERPDPGNGDDQ